jgi:eukaryotic-like serine/threonine-protein kinase
MPDLSSQDIGRYHVIETLGEGGMAIVYKAYDTRLEREVAIKFIRSDMVQPALLERMLKRFEREAHALAKMLHPNIIPIHDYGEHEGSPYLVMPFISGGTLKTRMERPMPYREAVDLILPMADALEYAHEQNIIHRDIKPTNILLTERGRPMLSDFGIAKILQIEETTHLTGTGVGIGTPEYMSPEQGMGMKIDHRTDIYSLGVVFYELVTGRKLYTADTPMAIVFKHVNDPLPRPRSYVPTLPEEVEHVLYKLLAKKAEDRYQTMGEVVQVLGKPAFSGSLSFETSFTSEPIISSNAVKLKEVPPINKPSETRLNEIREKTPAPNNVPKPSSSIDDSRLARRLLLLIFLSVLCVIVFANWK